MPLVTPRLFTEYPICRVQVDTPAPKSDGIFKCPLFYEVLLPQDVIAFKTSAFSFTRDCSYPFKGEVFGIRKFTGILYVIPYSINHFPQFPFYFFCLVDGIETAAIFNP